MHLLFFFAGVILDSGGPISYNRHRAAPDEETTIVTSWLQAEKPATPVAIEAGTTGVVDARCEMDMDPGAGADVIETARFEITPRIAENNGLGLLEIDIKFTPNDASEAAIAGKVRTEKFVHPHTIDRLQTDSGNARTE